MTGYVFAHDVGTGSVKTLLVDELGKILAESIEEYELDYPQAGWAEQNPEDYWIGSVKNTKKILDKVKIDPKNVLGIVFTTQALGIIPVDEKGEVLHPNISWLDDRAQKQANRMMNLFGGKRLFMRIFGLEITGKDVIPKLRWLKQNRRDIYDRTKYFLDVNGFLKYRATGVMVAEWSGACSYAFDLKKKDFDRLVFKIMGIDTRKLPPLVNSVQKVGDGLTSHAAEQMGLEVGTPVFGGCDDVPSAQIGSTAIDEGEAHMYLGTSSWISVSTSKSPPFKNGVAVLQSGDPEKQVVVGVTESAGKNIEWVIQGFYKKELRELGWEKIYAFVEKEIEETRAGADNLIVTPWVAGERAPVASTTTRATAFNLTLQHNRSHIARAVYEGVALNLKWVLEIMESSYNISLKRLKVVGGGSLSDTWMQIMADVCEREIVTVSNSRHAGAMGAAMIALVGSGRVKNFSMVKDLIVEEKVFIPNTSNQEIYTQALMIYKRIYKDLKNLYKLSAENRS